jgi:hypothetical protein
MTKIKFALGVNNSKREDPNSKTKEKPVSQRKRL